MAIPDLLFGRPLATSEERAEHIGPVAGIPIFGLDALSSAAYGPEAALTLLIPLGLMGVQHIVPIIAAILILLVIVYFSYRQTIDAYPHGGGSYTVASENLGPHAGLLAAAALMIDYVLTAAVGISAGVGALVSAVPALHPHLLSLCLGILLLLTLVNMRGVRDTGVAFMVPTYVFVGAILTVIGVGLYHAAVSGGHPAAIVAAPPMPRATEMLTWWLLLKVFASGCTAMTGVEAVSNGVMAFREPTQNNAKKTLTIIIALLIAMLAGIAWLCRDYGIGATDPEAHGYQSVLSMLTAAVMGRGVFYYVTIASILLVLSLSANTAFADFPRLTRMIALDDYLPHVFTVRGRRLLYSYGVYVLVALTAVLLIVFRGVTDRLIPLYAIGAFLAFTLSQAGMVMHWYKQGNAHLRMVVNGLGAVATGITLLVVLVAKFVEGAWVTVLLIGLLILLMSRVRKHYVRAAAETRYNDPIQILDPQPPIVVMPIDCWSRVTERALRFALIISPEVQAVHINLADEPDEICKEWNRIVADPLKAADRPVPRLVRLQSPYRYILTPLVNYVLDLEEQHPDRKIAVMVPQLVVRRWYENLLHNKRADLLKLMLMAKGTRRIVVINVPWYLDSPPILVNELRSDGEIKPDVVTFKPEATLKE